MLDEANTEGDLTFGLLSVGQNMIAVEASCLAEVAHISRLDEPLVHHPDVLGMLDIRGNLIPVCDPLSKFTRKTDADTPKTAAVIVSEGYAIALAVHGIHGLLRVAASDVRSMLQPGDPAFSKGYFLKDGSPIYVLDAEAIAKETRSPKAKFSRHKPRQRAKATEIPYLTFEVGNTMFAVPAEAVHGTVPAKEVDDATVATELCKGTINYYNRHVAVTNTNRVMGLGKSELLAKSETVVVKVDSDRLLGFSVDRICRMAYLEDNAFSPIPPHLAKRLNMVSATFEDNGVPHFLIDSALFTKTDALLPLASLSVGRIDSLVDSQGNTATKDSEAKAKIVRVRKRYLLFCAGTDMAAPLSDIISMQTVPEGKDVVEYEGFQTGHLGVVFYGKEIVPLISLAAYLGHPFEPVTNRSRLLFVEVENHKVAFLVEQAQSIATSVWETNARSDSLEPEAKLVSVTNNGGEEVWSKIDLSELASRILDPTSGWA